MRKILAVSFLLLILLVVMQDLALAQCSMCRTALESSEEGKALAQGLNKGILFLLFTPFMLFGTVSVFVYRSYQKRRRGL